MKYIFSKVVHSRMTKEQKFLKKNEFIKNIFGAEKKNFKKIAFLKNLVLRGLTPLILDPANLYSI